LLSYFFFFFLYTAFYLIVVVVVALFLFTFLDNFSILLLLVLRTYSFPILVAAGECVFLFYGTCVYIPPTPPSLPPSLPLYLLCWLKVAHPLQPFLLLLKDANEKAYLIPFLHANMLYITIQHYHTTQTVRVRATLF